MLSLIIAASQALLTVFAAASLHGAFDELGKSFSKSHPAVSVRFNYDGSQVLELQLAQGAQADVFASADPRWMDEAARHQLVGDRALFATNTLVLVASPGSVVHSTKDLALPGNKLVLCADAVPCGRYARQLLAKLDADPAFGAQFSTHVLGNVVSEEQNVEDVFTKVLVDAADSGIVYHSDAASRSDLASKGVRVIEFPASAQPPIVYPIAPVSASKSPQLAAEFVSFVRSPAGQAILKRSGFGPTP